MPREIWYWVMFENGRAPEKFIARSLLEFIKELERHMAQRGPIEWMIRGY